MADQEADVDRGAVLVDAVEVLAERMPVPRDPQLEGLERHALDLDHHPLEVLTVGLVAERCEREPAVPGDHRGHAEEVGRRGPGVPEELGVVVRVGVDEAGADGEAGGVDGLGRLLADVADGDDAAVADADVGSDPGGAGAVDHGAALDDHVEHGAVLRIEVSVIVWRTAGF